MRNYLKSYRIIIAFLLVSFIGFGFGDGPNKSPDPDEVKPTLRSVEHNSFSRGEKLIYDVHYGFISAGNVTLTVENENLKINNRDTYHVVGIGETVGIWDWVFKVRDRYESYIDQTAILPWKFVRRVDEGGYKINRDISFDQYKNVATVEGKGDYPTQENSQDLISMFYYARTINFADAAPGDTFLINTFLDYENIPMQIKYVGIEDVKISIGTFTCYKFHPRLQEGRVFKDEEDMTIWVTADQSKVPIRMKSNILIGSVNMDLESYSGVTGKLNKVKD